MTCVVLVIRLTELHHDIGLPKLNYLESGHTQVGVLDRVGVPDLLTLKKVSL